MSQNPPNYSTTITLAGQPATLTYDHHARFRFGRAGGNINAMFNVPGQDYYHTILVIWAALDDETRRRYPDPALLVEHIPYELQSESKSGLEWPASVASEIIEPAFLALYQAGWLQASEPQKDSPTADASSPSV